ncbi:1430_t:CDS:2, partial [Cetraspora pellucida]
MPKLANIKKLQKERAEVARSALANYVDLDSSEDDFLLLRRQDKKNLNEELDGNLSEELDEETKKIHSAIEFVDNVMREETLSKTEEARYTAVIYFYRLLLKGQKKMDAAKVVSDVIDGGLWLANLLHDELVSLELAAYLRSQKFNVDPIMVKDYFEQIILSQLNIKSVQCISVRTARRWMHKLGFRPEKEQPLRKKGLGSAIHISDFLTKTIGSLKDDQEEAPFSEDALVALKMNLGLGGLVSKMRDTTWNGDRQSMIIENDHLIYDKKKKTYVNLRGQPKGIQWVLSERELLKDGMVLECASCKKKDPIPDVFASISVEKICSFTRLSYRWMDAYRHGLMEKIAEYAVRNNRKHRSINEE